MSAAAAATPATTLIGDITVYDDYVHQLERIPTESHPAPFLLKEYVDGATSSGTPRDQFIYDKNCQFQLQLRSGPLIHREFHIQGGDEWYFAVRGSAVVRLLDGRSLKERILTEGACCLIPAGTPKAIQIEKGANIIVMTRQRKTEGTYAHYNRTHTVEQLTHLNGNAVEPNDPLDQMIWMCSSCGGVAHKEEFLCIDYFTQSTAIIQSFDERASSGKIVCQSCQSAYSHNKTIITDSDSSLETPAGISAFIEVHAKLPTQLPESTPAFPTIDSATYPPPYHLFSWIATHEHLLAPPVCNSMIHSRGCQWKVMIVGGPNNRTDYHIDDGEEWFLMIKGDMCLSVVDECGTVFRDIIIKEGESFLLPANVPHSPQRFADTIGLVIERERFTYELDGLRWWCGNPSCRAVLRTFSFRCEDLGSQLKQLITYWYEDSEEGKKRRTCSKCGHEEKKPTNLAQVKQWTH